MANGKPEVCVPVSTPPSPKGTVELRALTGIRFFAAFLVVIYHYAQLYMKAAPPAIQNVVGTGYVCVDFFFILSGFVLAYSSIKESGTLRTTAASFWAARIGRIYPAYLTAFLIVIPSNIMWSLHLNSLKVGIVKLMVGGALVLAMVQSWTPWSAWYWNSPAWSLSVEIFFYFAFPFLVPLIARLDRRACIALLPLVWLIGLVAPAILISMQQTSANPPFSSLQLAVEVTPIFRLPEFVGGMLLGRAYFLDTQRSRKTGGAVAIAGIAILALLLSLGNAIPRPLLANGLAAPLFGLIIFGLAQGRGALAAFLSTPPLVLLGEASYGIYILQYPIAVLFGVSDHIHTPARTALYIVGLIIISIFCFRYIESPLRGRIRRALTDPLEGLVARAKAGRQHRNALGAAL